MSDLTEAMRKQMARLQRGEDIKSSDRFEDEARTKLKKMGLIRFDRAAWLWRLTDDGFAILANYKGSSDR